MSTKGNNWTMGCPDGLCCANIDGIMMTNDYLLGFERNAEYSIRFLARIMHRFLSRSDESADLARRATEAPANVLYGTLRRPTECNAGRSDDFVGAVENLCIIRA